MLILSLRCRCVVAQTIKTQSNPYERQKNTLVSRDSNVVLLDIDPPVINLPEAINLQATSQSGIEAQHQLVAKFLSSVSATDAIDGEITAIEHNAPEILPYGDITVEFTACDRSGIAILK